MPDESLKVSSAQKHKLRHLMKELKEVQGRHTELVTVYVPEGYDINKITNHLQQEQGTASNIKSKQTRDNVIAALERMIRHLKLFTRTPPNGLACFAGNVSSREGQQDFKVWSLEPPVPLKIRIYRCDKEFVLEPILEMCEEKSIYGLVVMDKREGNVAILKGKAILPLNNATSAVPGKTRAGGQCLDPDTMITLADGTMTKLSNIQIGDELSCYDIAQQKITSTECTDFIEVVKSETVTVKTASATIISSLDHTFFVKAGGTIREAVANTLSRGDLLLIHKEGGAIAEEEIVSIIEESGRADLIDISTEQENFFGNGILVHNSSVRFERLRELAAIDFMKKIAEMMKDAFLENRDLKGILIGGPGHTKNEFADSNYITDQLKRKIIGVKDLAYTGEFGLQELVEKSEDILSEEEVMEEKKMISRLLTLLATKPGMVAYGKVEVLDAIRSGLVDILLLSEALSDEEIEALEKEGEAMGSKIMLVSVDTREGVQLKDLGKIAAILRYEMHRE